ncbi:hypothetical protein GCWU000324_00770 [Kingella oralis ATCC 51147]|uniref:Uncharacterized protein n=1 Tax=Kingella oralis ATCC 51147 TaxID=629741 RepID=C4GF57_9NEIS|nr:hypothetical protein GCWU000324_00770 [Kingella oralis ATCC 51147]
MENHVYSSTASEPMNHTPDVAVGLASMPAPIIVPAIIIAPPSRVGVLVVIGDSLWISGSLKRGFAKGVFYDIAHDFNLTLQNIFRAGHCCVFRLPMRCHQGSLKTQKQNAVLACDTALGLLLGG